MGFCRICAVGAGELWISIHNLPSGGHQQPHSRSRVQTAITPLHRAFAWVAHRRRAWACRNTNAVQEEARGVHYHPGARASQKYPTRCVSQQHQTVYLEYEGMEKKPQPHSHQSELLLASELIFKYLKEENFTGACWFHPALNLLCPRWFSPAQHLLCL